MSSPDDRIAETDIVAPKARDAWEVLAVFGNQRIQRSLCPPCDLIVGRDPASDICLDHASVSRRHAKLSIRETATIEDLGSSNGTRVDGRTIPTGQSAYVRQGSVVELGDIVLLVRPPALLLENDLSESRLGVSGEMSRVLEFGTAASHSALHVLISGEQGSGRAWLASRIHQGSPRAATPFTVLQAEELTEVALVGTSAAAPGLLERARGTMLLLRDPEHLSERVQSLLEKALTEGKVVRADGSQSATLDVRIVATTELSLGAFRTYKGMNARLYAHLCGLSAEMPPLRTRRGEIRHLAERFLLEAPRQGMTFNEAALGKLLLHTWPLNVAELKETVLRAAALAPSLQIRQDEVVFAGEATAASHSETDDEKERQRVLAALELCGGNQRKAADMLGISRRTMVNRMNQLNLPRPRK
jgi:two-component system, NtrC family, response regulator AtoC